MTSEFTIQAGQRQLILTTEVVTKRSLRVRYTVADGNNHLQLPVDYWTVIDNYLAYLQQLDSSSAADSSGDRQVVVEVNSTPVSNKRSWLSMSQWSQWWWSSTSTSTVTTNTTTITQANYLKSCFYLSDYLRDRGYYRYLVQQLVVNLQNNSDFDFNNFSVNGVKQGRWTVYSGNNIISTGIYIDDVEVGYWSSYLLATNNGKRVLLSRGHYQAGRKVGMWQTFHNSGQLQTVGNYVDGDKDGLWLGNFDTATTAVLESEAYYQKGQLAQLKSYYPNGQLQTSQTYLVTDDGGGGGSGDASSSASNSNVDQRLHGPAYYYRMDGSLSSQGHYCKGSKVGYWQEINDRQVRSQGNYIDDVKSGTWSVFYADGRPLAVESYQAGQLHGQVITYIKLPHPSLEEIIEPVELTEIGLVSTVDTNSDNVIISNDGLTQAPTIMIVANYDQGTRHGVWDSYDHHNRKLVAGQYHKGKKSGCWQYYCTPAMVASGVVGDSVASSSGVAFIRLYDSEGRLTATTLLQSTVDCNSIWWLG